LSRICCVIIEECSAVFKECTITGDGLPHGDVDIIAGQNDCDSGEINWSFGVQVSVDSETTYSLQSPVGVTDSQI
jgi:hypothetical protein